MRFYKILTIKEYLKILLYKYLFNNIFKINMGDIVKKINIEKTLVDYNIKVVNFWPYLIIKTYVNDKEVNFILRKGKSSDLYVFCQLIIQNEYFEAISLINKYNIKINSIVDLGGNIGLSVIYFSLHFNDAKIICLEPSRSNFKQMHKNLIKNKINSIILNKAIWHEEVLLEISKDFRDGKEWSFATKPLFNKNGNNIVNSITLESIFRIYEFREVDLLKIDIEGAEKQLFLEYPDIDQVLKKIKIIIIEIHDETGVRDEIYKILRRNDFFQIECQNEYTVCINKKYLC